MFIYAADKHHIRPLSRKFLDIIACLDFKRHYTIDAGLPLYRHEFANITVAVHKDPRNTN